MKCKARKAACMCFRKIRHAGNHKCLCSGTWNKHGKIVVLPDPTRIISYTVLQELHKEGT